MTLSISENRTTVVRNKGTATHMKDKNDTTFAPPTEKKDRAGQFNVRRSSTTGVSSALLVTLLLMLVACGKNVCADASLQQEDLGSSLGDENEPDRSLFFKEKTTAQNSPSNFASSRRLQRSTVKLTIPELTKPSLENSSEKNQENEHDGESHGRAAAASATLPGRTVIVGAGATGMFAAYTLKYLQGEGNPSNIVMLEAADQFGGRVKEIDSNYFPGTNVPLDLGAEWVHYEPNTLQDLLLFPLEAGQSVPEVMEYRPQTYKSWFRNKLRSHNWMSDEYSEWKFKDSTWYRYLENLIYPHIADELKLETPVTKIDSSDPNTIRVYTANNEIYEADRVVIATPSSILKSNSIDFVPNLPGRIRNNIRKVELSPGLKVLIAFDEKFYPDILVPERFREFWQDDYDERTYYDALFGKADGIGHVLGLLEVGYWDDGLHLLGSDEEIIQSILQELDAAFDGEATRHYVSHHIENWSANPYIRGTYPMNFLDYQGRSLAKLKRPFANQRIYLAGEYLAEDPTGEVEDFTGTVHAAATEGRRVAEKIFNDHAT